MLTATPCSGVRRETTLLGAGDTVDMDVDLPERFRRVSTRDLPRARCVLTKRLDSEAVRIFRNKFVDYDTVMHKDPHEERSLGSAVEPIQSVA